MVAVDENGQPIEVPPLEPTTPEGIRRFQQAQKRREIRQMLEDKYKDISQ